MMFQVVMEVAYYCVHSFSTVTCLIAEEINLLRKGFTLNTEHFLGTRK